MPRCVLDPCVAAELKELWLFIAQDNPDAADRVVEAAYATFQLLASNSSLGRKRHFKNPKADNVRSLTISGFDHYLIFYRPIQDGVQVHHVYHGARDLNALFEKL